MFLHENMKTYKIKSTIRNGRFSHITIYRKTWIGYIPIDTKSTRADAISFVNHIKSESTIIK